MDLSSGLKALEREEKFSWLCTACKGVQRNRQQARTKHLTDQALCKHCQSQCAFLYVLTPDTRTSKNRNSCYIAVNSIWFYDPGKILTPESPMLLSETNLFPRWQCFRFMYVKWGTSDQEQILHCSQTHSPPNNTKKAAPGYLFPYLWLVMDNFQSLTCQSLTEGSALFYPLFCRRLALPSLFFKNIWPTLHLISELWPAKIKCSKES